MVTISIARRVRDDVECMRVRRFLQAFLDGTLDEERHGRVARHLEACRRCGLSAEAYRSLKDQLRAQSLPVDPDAVGRLERFVDHLAGDDPRPPTGD